MAVSYYQQHRPREATITVSMAPDYSGDFVCDGVADDVEIQAAITFCNALGREATIKLGYGDYQITAGMTSTEQISINGDGMESTRLQGTGAFTLLAIAGGGIFGGYLGNMRIYGQDTLITVDNAIHFTFEKINFYNTDGTCIIASGNSFHVAVRNCRFVASGTYGIQTIDTAAVHLVNNDFAGDCTASIRLAGGNSRIEHNYFEITPPSSAVHIICDGGSAQIIGNFIGSTGDGAQQIIINASDYILIDGNHIEGANTTAIELSASAGNYIVISNNTISNFKTYAIDIDGGGDIIIEGNVFYALSGNTPSGFIDSSFQRWVVVTGNQFRMNNAYDIYAAVYVAVFSGNNVEKSGGCSLVQVASGNVISGGDKTVVSFGINNAEVVVGNQITNVRYGVGIYAVEVVCTCNEINTVNTAGIYVASDRGIVSFNNIHDSADAGIFLVDADDTTIQGNTISGSTAFDINISDAASSGTYVKNNRLFSANKIQDLGTDTRLATVKFQFIQGTTFISADGSAKGWEINAEADMAVALGHLSLEVQQVVRIKIWAVALGAPPGSPGSMHLDILFNAGESLEAYNLAANSWTLANFDSEEADYVNTNVIHWVIEDGDVGTELANLLGGDSLELKVNGGTAVAPDGATNATFRVVEIEYV